MLRIKPCPYCGKLPEVSVNRFRCSAPMFTVRHQAHDMLSPECPGSEYDSANHLSQSLTDAIRNWNRWTILAYEREGFDAWTSF